MLQLPVPEAGHREYSAPLHGSSDALAIATLAARARPLLVIIDTASHAQRLLEEIPYFDPKLKVHLFPDWETLPYDHFSPHADLISERLATLYAPDVRRLAELLPELDVSLWRSVSEVA